jgi:hypothetical protein
MRDMASRIAAARGRVKEMDEDASPTVAIAKDQIAIAEGQEVTYFKPKKLEVPLKFSVVGGSGWDFCADECYTLMVTASCLKFTCADPQKEIAILFDDLTAVEISGGSQTTNMGLVGGGFGLEGAVAGIAFAGIVNALTTTTVTNTYVRLASRESEVFIHTVQLDSAPLRLILSPAIVRMEAGKLPVPRISIASQIEQLHQLLKAGALTEQEFSRVKVCVIEGAGWPKTLESK